MIPETLIDTNTARVEQATKDSSAAQIDDVERRANANVQAVKSEEGRLNSGGGNADAAKFMIGMAVEAIVPGAHTASLLADGANQRLEDKAGSRPVGIDTHIRDSFKSGENLMSRVGITSGSLTNKAAGDAATKDFFGGGKKNAANIPTDEQAAASVSNSHHKVVAAQHVHKLALDSVPAARATHSAAMHQAKQLAPGLSMNNGPSFNARQILQEPDRYRDEQGQA